MNKSENTLPQLLSVPQNPEHHPEGSAWRHTYMVRSSLDSALNLLKKYQLEDPEGPFSNLDLNFSKSDYNLLRLSAWLHDAGKAVTTEIKNGKITQHGHDSPSNFEKALAMLGPMWRNMYDKASDEDKSDLWFVIQYHMRLDDDAGFSSKKLRADLLDQNGKYKSDRRVKILLVLLLMDRLGRGGSPEFTAQQSKDFARNNVDAGKLGVQGMYRTVDVHKKEMQRLAAHQTKPMSNDPVQFVADMRKANKNPDVIRQALKGKFGMNDQEISGLLGESISFKRFMENENNPYTMRAKIPLPEDVFTLSKVFKKNGFFLYVVGGAVRDYLIHHFDNDEENYSPKDVDLATNAQPREVERILSKDGIRNFEKGESFGVWVAHLNGEDYEIATFREDLGYSDGRRPDAVKWSDPASDYKRRDLTMNALFYDIPSSSGEMGQVIDYGGGQGIQDIKDRRVRVVGDPYDRFGEDKLRIPRIARFHSRFNTDDVKSALDQRTLDAIDHYKDLRAHGVTGPRIQQEFLAGLYKSKDTISYLKNYESLGLLPSVFPGLQLDMEDVVRLTDQKISKNPIVVLALLLRKAGTPEKVRSALNKLNWPNDISDEVSFLLKTWETAKNPSPESMVSQAIVAQKNPDRKDHLKQFGSLVGHEIDQSHWDHLGDYVPATYNGEEIQKDLGIKPGPEVGKEIKRRQAAHYDNNFQQWLTRRSQGS